MTIMLWAAGLVVFAVAVGGIVVMLTAKPMPHPEELPVRYTHAAPPPDSIRYERFERVEAESRPDGARWVRRERWERPVR